MPNNEPTVAEKRDLLRNAGVAVGTRGRLSAEAEAVYAEIVKASGKR
jgi:hypothetical protein